MSWKAVTLVLCSTFVFYQFSFPVATNWFLFLYGGCAFIAYGSARMALFQRIRSDSWWVFVVFFPFFIWYFYAIYSGVLISNGDSMVRYVFMFFLLFVMWNTVDRETLEVIVKCIVVLAAMDSVYSVVQLVYLNTTGDYRVLLMPTSLKFDYGGPGIRYAGFHMFRAIGVFARSVENGLFLVPITLLMEYVVLARVRLFQSGFDGVILMLLIMGLGTTLSLNAYLTFISGTLYLLYKERRLVRSLGNKRTIYSFVGLFSVLIGVFALTQSVDIGEFVRTRMASILTGQDGSFVSRWGSVTYGVEILMSSPLLGIGIGNYANLPSAIDTSVKSQYVALVVDIGFLGSSLVAAVFLRLLSRSKRLLEYRGLHYMLVGYFFFGLFEPILFSPLFWLALGSLAVAIRVESQTRGQKGTPL